MSTVAPVAVSKVAYTTAHGGYGGYGLGGYGGYGGYSGLGKYCHDEIIIRIS